MSNERYNQVIDEAHENYLKNWKPQPVVEDEYYWMENELVSDRPLPKDMFIHCIKKDSEFSETWGLKIEERELSFNHRYRLGDYQPYNIEGKVEYEKGLDYITHEQFETFHNKEMDKLNIPTKLITLIYNDETIESYE